MPQRLEMPHGSASQAPMRAKLMRTQPLGSTMSTKSSTATLMWSSATSWTTPTLMANLIISHMLTSIRMESSTGIMLCLVTLHGIIQYVKQHPPVELTTDDI